MTRPDPATGLAENEATSPGFGIYIHWPYCEAICPYCDFNVRVARDVDVVAWRDAFRRRLRRYGAELPGRVVGSVYFGGGTPSLMPPSLVCDILCDVSDIWTFSDDPEITLEANPTSAEMSRFQGFAEAGVNRLSLGIQALDDAALRRLGRRHDGRSARQALERAQRTFARTTFDLIYGRQDQTVSDWERELRTALSLGGTHCSLYQLTIEPGTPFAHRLKKGRLPGLPDSDRSADFYDVTAAICDEAGLRRYEVSNHAVPGAESRHNMLYWTGGEWLGLGPGAHGRIEVGGRRMATLETRDPGTWLGSDDPESWEALDPEAVAEEALIGGLRIDRGVTRDRLRAVGYECDPAKVAQLVDDGLLVSNERRLRLTERGMPLLDAILGALVPLQPLGQQRA